MGTDDVQGSNEVILPADEAKLNHIFCSRSGHLEDTTENRKLLKRLANDDTKFLGNDRYGNSWNAEVLENGFQLWVRYRKNLINEGGINTTPRRWDNDTGLNNNPFK